MWTRSLGTVLLFEKRQCCAAGADRTFTTVWTDGWTGVGWGGLRLIDDIFNQHVT